MSWGRLDDRLHASAKFAKVHDPKHPGSVWVVVLSWALGPSARKVPGFVPTEIARRYGSPSAIKKLVAASLWIAVDGGFEIHDFADYAERGGATSKSEDDQELSAKRAEAGRRGGIRSAEKRRENDASPDQSAKQKDQANEAKEGQAKADFATQANAPSASARARACVPDPDPDPDPERERETPPAPSPPRVSKPVVLTADAKAVRDALQAEDVLTGVDPSSLDAAAKRMAGQAMSAPRCPAGSAVLYVPEAVVHGRKQLASERDRGRSPGAEWVLAAIEQKFGWLIGDVNAGKREPLKPPKPSEPGSKKPLMERWGG